MRTVICFSGDSGNNALRTAAIAHRIHYEDYGFRFEEVDFGASDATKRLDRLLGEGNIELVYAPMGLAQDIKVNREGELVSLWDATGIPFLSLLGDTPGYFFDRHVATSKWHALLYFFPDHLAIRQRFPGGQGLRGSIPPIPFDAHPKSSIDFQAKEGGRLLFLKNGNDPERLVKQWREGLPASTFVDLTNLASELASALGRNAHPDIDAHVSASFAAKGMDISNLPRLRLLFLAQIDDYLRRVKSTMIGKVLSEFPIDFVGDNWDHVDFRGRPARYAHGIDYAATGDVIRRSLGVIDMSPNTQLAPHDRPMRAFGNHTLCLTNEQSFFRENLPGSGEVLFRFEEDHLRDLVGTVIAHPRRFVELGATIAEDFSRVRHPRDFATFTLETAALIRAGCGPQTGEMQPYFQWAPSSLEGTR